MGNYTKRSYTIVCEYCGKQATAKKRGTRFCSKKCRDIALRLKKGISCNPNTEPFHRVCAVCGKPFDSFREAQKTCSTDCAQKYHSKNRFVPTQRDPRMCDVCGAIFIPKSNRQISCSRECFLKKYNETRNARRAATRPEPIEKVCPICGGTFFSDPWREKKYCSERCAKAKQRKRHDKRIPRDRRKDNIKLKDLFKRDGGKCYICGGDCDWNDWRTNKAGNKYPGDSYPTIDHILPVSRGGYDAWDNVRLACWKCNMEKSDSIVDDEGMTMEFAYSAKREPTPGKKTAQYSLDGKLIRIWESTAQIRRETGLSDKHIQNVCRGDNSNTGNAYGFHWEYIEEQHERVC